MEDVKKFLADPDAYAAANPVAAAPAAGGAAEAKKEEKKAQMEKTVSRQIVEVLRMRRCNVILLYLGLFPLPSKPGANASLGSELGFPILNM